MRGIKNRFAIGALSATLSLAALAGCESTQDKAHRGVSAGRVNDDKIVKDVRAQLKREPIYKFDSVFVNSVEGVVRLSGLVTHLEQRKRAEEIAKNTRGVTGVLNGLLLQPEETATPAIYIPGKLYSAPPGEGFRE